MNIFVLDRDPIKAAQYLCNKHITKMLLESIQMLSFPYPDYIQKPYKGQSHYNHPCSQWARKCENNFEWLLQHTQAISDEYAHRYNRVHNWTWIVDWFADSYAILNLPRFNNITPFHLSMPDQYKTSDPIESYRNYYVGDKSKFAKWKIRQPPDWYIAKLNESN